MAALFFSTSLGLAYLNRNVDIAPSLLDKAVVEENVVTEIRLNAPAQEDSAASFDLPPLPEIEEDFKPSTVDGELPEVPEAVD